MRGEGICLKLLYQEGAETEFNFTDIHYTLLPTVLICVILNSYQQQLILNYELVRLDILPRNYDL